MSYVTVRDGGQPGDAEGRNRATRLPLVTGVTGDWGVEVGTVAIAATGHTRRRVSCGDAAHRSAYELRRSRSASSWWPCWLLRRRGYADRGICHEIKVWAAPHSVKDASTNQNQVRVAAPRLAGWLTCRMPLSSRTQRRPHPRGQAESLAPAALQALRRPEDQRVPVPGILSA